MLRLLVAISMKSTKQCRKHSNLQVAGAFTLQKSVFFIIPGMERVCTHMSAYKVCLKLNRIVSTVLLGAFLCAMTFATAATAAERKLAYIAIDGKTGKVLLQKDSTKLRHPASLTKMMTLYILFDALDRGVVRMDTKLKVSKNASSKPASKIYVSPGRPISVDTAIDALIIKSANDVATVVAENLAGSEEEFANQMSSAARQLGMHSTVFKNASGLHHDEQVTTAYDMALMALALQDRFPQLYKRFAKPAFTHGRQTYREYNPMLGSIPGVDGLKTGYTKRSGFNLATNRRHNDKHVIAVVLGTHSSDRRTKTMSGLLSDAQKVASTGPRRIGLMDKRVYTDSFTVTWANGVPSAEFGRALFPATQTPQRHRQQVLRGKKLSPKIKPAGLEKLPDNFFARDQEMLAIMLRDLSGIETAPNYDDLERQTGSLFTENALWGSVNSNARVDPVPLVSINDGTYQPSVGEVVLEARKKQNPSLYGQVTKK